MRVHIKKVLQAATLTAKHCHIAIEADHRMLYFEMYQYQNNYFLCFTYICNF